MTIEKDEGVSNESGKTLLPCPFCGKQPRYGKVSIGTDNPMVICGSSYQETGRAHCPASYACVTVAQWNQRKDSALTQQLAQLQAQNAELVNEVAGHHFVRNERDRLLEQNTAIQSRCEGLERALDIARIEQERFAAQSNKFAEILGGILHIIPPDFVTPDGKIMQFVPPDPLAYLRALANSISKAYAALSPSGKAGEGETFDLIAHLHRQRAFSERTFGPGMRTASVSDHIRKELAEVAKAPSDLEEWIDVVMLSLDGAWRSGHTPEQISAALAAKLKKNEGRKWPDWRTMPEGKAIEHDRSADASPTSEGGGSV